MRVLAAGSGSTGAVYLLNHKLSGGAILHTTFALPEDLEREAVARFGAAPPAGTPNDARNRRAVDLVLDLGLKRVDPVVTLLWISDPDTTAHAKGVGDPSTIEAIRHADGEIKRIEEGLQRAGLLDSFNIWVTSDHGFSTYTAAPDIAAIIEPFAGVLGDGTPRIVTGAGAVYVRDRDGAAISAIVKQLQRTPGIGAVFTPAAGAGGLHGRESGTISYDAIEWNHARRADILFSPDWTDQRNAFGYAGTTASGRVAGHGSSSPHDIHNVLVAAGPDLKQGAVVSTPTGNVDFAPTFLHLLGVDVPPSMQGRVLREALAAGGGGTPDAAGRSDGQQPRPIVHADGKVLGRFSRQPAVSLPGLHQGRAQNRPPATSGSITAGNVRLKPDTTWAHQSKSEIRRTAGHFSIAAAADQKPRAVLAGAEKRAAAGDTPLRATNARRRSRDSAAGRRRHAVENSLDDNVTKRGFSTRVVRHHAVNLRESRHPRSNPIWCSTSVARCSPMFVSPQNPRFGCMNNR